VIQTLVDVVSKNGDLLLSIPVRGNGTIDDKEEAVLRGIGAWMDVNKECIFGTRPWKVFGEGPTAESPAKKAANFTEGKGKKFTAADIRFTEKGGSVYAVVFGAPGKELTLQSLGTDARLLEKPVGAVVLLGSAEKLVWSQNAAGLTITSPKVLPNDFAVVFKITSR
jgi:alpha-L-fucosidase